MRALLDINVLIALHDRDHVHHSHATSWLAANIKHGWASCPLTQNGCLRIMSQDGYSNPQPLSVLMPMLLHSTSDAHHHFWSDDISLRTEGLVNWDRVFSHGQITDLYLLALAVAHDGALATFDHRIALNAVARSEKHNLLLL